MNWVKYASCSGFSALWVGRGKLKLAYCIYSTDFVVFDTEWECLGCFVVGCLLLFGGLFG